MATVTSTETAVPKTSTAVTNDETQPQEQLEVEESGPSDEAINFPSGPKVWLTMTSLCIAQFLHGLDMTIVAVAVPSLTDQFKTVNDIGWYSAAYGLTASAFLFFFGKVYTVFPIKTVFIFGLVVFEAGSLLCTLAPNSAAFIVGRAIAGVGCGAFSGGLLKLLRHCFPLRKQALMVGLAGGCQSVGLVIAPVLGGIMIDRVSWRLCFGINIPFGVLCIVLTAYGFHDPVPNPDTSLPLKEKVKRLNMIDTVFVVPAITCLLLALQWGGVTYGWGNVRIIVLLILFAILFSGFGYLQYRRGEDATVPLRVIKQRSIMGAMWYNACCNGVLATTEYYISIYYQGVRGFSATKSGLLGIPMIIGFSVAMMAAAAGTTMIGYYFPFMIATNILAPVASGLLTTIDLDTSVVATAALLGFVGVAIGLSIQSPSLAVQTVLPIKDVSLGGAIIGFGGGMGSALWICASATLFQNRLVDEVRKYSPATNETALEAVGLSGIRNYVGSERLQAVLSGYNEAVIQTLFMPVALSILTILGTLVVEKRSIKKKQT